MTAADPGHQETRSFADLIAYLNANLNDLDASLDADPATLTPDQVRWERIGTDARQVLRDIATRAREGDL